MYCPVNSKANFTVTATSASTLDRELQFQWYKRTNGVSEKMLHKTENTLIIDRVSLSDVGFYKCTVTNPPKICAGAKDKTSKEAELRLCELLQLVCTSSAFLCIGSAESQ